jgi:hypothetical protein
MPILYDSFGNQKSFLDGVGGATTYVDTRPIAPAALAAINAEVVLPLHAAGVVAIDLRSAAFNGTVEVSGTIDGTNFFPLPVFVYGQNVAAPSLVLSGAIALAMRAPCVGLRAARCRVVAYTSGALTCTMRSSTAPLSIDVPLSTNLHATATGAVNTAVSLSVPAVAGFTHVFSRITVQRFFATAGLAGATPTLVTSSNLPGTRVLSFGTSGAIGTLAEQSLVGLLPVRSTLPGVATAIACPASTDTIWRVSADYTLAA